MILQIQCHFRLPFKERTNRHVIKVIQYIYFDIVMTTNDIMKLLYSILNQGLIGRILNFLPNHNKELKLKKNPIKIWI